MESWESAADYTIVSKVRKGITENWLDLHWVATRWGGRFYPIILELALKYRQWKVLNCLLNMKGHMSAQNFYTIVCYAVRNDEVKQLAAAKFCPYHFLFKVALRAAVSAGDQHGLQRLMQNVPKESNSFSYLGEIFCSAASLAMKRGYVEIAENLISHTSVRFNQRSLYTVFQFATDNGDHSESSLNKRFEELILRESRIEPFFFHLAVQSGSRSCFQKLREYDERKRDQNEHSGRSMESDDGLVLRPESLPLLHVAAYYGHEDMVRLLLRQFSVRREIDSLGRTALHTATGEGYMPVVVELLKQIKPIEVNDRDHDGMTALHLAACAGHATVLQELVSASECLINVQAGTFTSQMVLLESFLTEAMYCSETLDSLTFPRPSNVKSVFWSPGGFTPLHFAAVYGGKTVLEELLKQPNINVVLEDDEGLTAYDWADACGLGQSFKDCLDDENLLRKASPINLMRARSFLEEAKRTQKMKKHVEWCYEMGRAVMSKQWVLARGLVSQVSKWETKIDPVTWGCLLHAFDKATSILEAPFSLTHEDLERNLKNHADWANMFQMAHEEAETIVLQLLKAGAIADGTLQACLMWAIRRNMVRIAEWLISREKTVNCNLPTPHMDTKGNSEVHSTPLEFASRLRREKIVQSMGQREDVKKAMYEDRQVYVDYANTILVGAVLIAGLAYPGWLQPPQGYKDSSVNTDNYMVWLFSRFNSFGFILAMATVIVGATGAMPTPSGKLGNAKKNALRAVSVASLLFVAAVVCVMVAFTAAGLAVLPKWSRSVVHKSATLGAVLGSFLLVWFIDRLLDLSLGIDLPNAVWGKLSRLKENPLVKTLLFPTFEKLLYLAREKLLYPAWKHLHSQGQMCCNAMHRPFGRCRNCAILDFSSLGSLPSRWCEFIQTCLWCPFTFTSSCFGSIYYYILNLVKRHSRPSPASRALFTI